MLPPRVAPRLTAVLVAARPARLIVLTLSAAVLAIGLALAMAAGPAQAVGIDETCSLAFVKVDPNVLNVAYPDAAALYFIVSYQGSPGTQLEIDGTYPHARYMSFTAYDPALRPLDAINDIHIAPDAGSADPFIAGALRRTPAGQRHYTAYVQFGPRPASPAPNTVYTGTGQNGTPNLAGSIIYRIYIPDAGTDESGGVGLPTVTLEPAGAHAGPGTTSPCTGAQAPAPPIGVNSVLSTADGEPALETHGFTGANPPVWSKFLNAAYSLSEIFTQSGGGTFAPLDGPIEGATATAGGSGGFLSNLDNAYVFAAVNRGYGQVLVAHLRVASFADTRAGQSPMPAAQLRYWSMCENDPFTERYVACDSDDQTVQRPAGEATFVMSTPAQRPPNATAACGVNWLPWGADPAGVLILRNMLPDAGFAQAIQRATLGHEEQTMGAYLPASSYTSSAAFARLGCAGATGATPPATRGAGPGRPFSCARPTGGLSAGRLGPVALGMTRARVRRQLARVPRRGRRLIDVFCPSHGGLRVGYGAARPVAGPASGPAAAEARRMRGRVVLILTADRRYGVRGVRPRTPLAVARRRLALSRPYAVGANRWYLAPDGTGRVVLKVRAGRVAEVGIADRALSTPRLAPGFLRSFG